VAKHAIPVIKERMKMIEDAENKGIEPNLPVGISNPSRKIFFIFPGYTL
jgi:hypothetical protein